MKAEEILKLYETYVTMKQPYNTTSIFLKESVLKAMKEYARIKCKEQRKLISKCKYILKTGTILSMKIINKTIPKFD